MALSQRLETTRNRINRTLDAFEEFATLYFAWVLAASLTLTQKIDNTINALLPGNHKINESGQVDTIITVVVIAVIAVVGILIYSEVNQNISVTGALATSQTNLTEGFGDAMDLVPIVMIVLVAALVIGVISRFR